MAASMMSPVPSSFIPSPESPFKKMGLSFTHFPTRRQLKHFRATAVKIQFCLHGNVGGQVLQGSTMEEIYVSLAQRVLSAASTTPSSSKYIIGLAGPPGAGKSTVAEEVAGRVNKLWAETKQTDDNAVFTDEVAVILPMDGFHLYRRQLDAMENPAEAHARRGAPWTFDSAGFVKCLVFLREKGWVSAPSFDHGVGDPKDNDIFVLPSHRVVIVEGNYLLLPDDNWKDLANIFNERWFLDVNTETALRRVEERFINLGREPREVKARVEYNDRKNAEIIATTKVFADLVIKAVDMAG